MLRIYQAIPVVFLEAHLRRKGIPPELLMIGVMDAAQV
jgi:hypothetical protein